MNNKTFLFVEYQQLCQCTGRVAIVFWVKPVFGCGVIWWWFDNGRDVDVLAGQLGLDCEMGETCRGEIRLWICMDISLILILIDID